MVSLVHGANYTSTTGLFSFAVYYFVLPDLTCVPSGIFQMLTLCGGPPEISSSSFNKTSTGKDRYSGHGYSGIDRFSGTKNPDDAILFTVSGITAIVEQKFRKFQVYSKISGFF